MTTVVPTFALEVPPGFIQVPVHAADPNDLTEEDVRQVRAQFHSLFDNFAEDGDEGLDMTAAALVAFGVTAATANARVAAAGLMRSPDAPRPVLVQLTALQVAAQQPSAAWGNDSCHFDVEREYHRLGAHRGIVHEGLRVDPMGVPRLTNKMADPDPDTFIGLLLAIPMFALFLITLIPAIIEAAVHKLVINPIRRLCQRAVRHAGSTINVRHIEPIAPSRLPEYKRGGRHETHTTTTLWVADKSTAKNLQRQLKERLVPGASLTNPPISDLLAGANARVVNSRSEYVS